MDNRNYETPFAGQMNVFVPYICWAIVALVLVPNIFLFSVDDMVIASYPDPLGTIASDQALNGRYGLASLSLLIKALRGTHVELQLVGALTMLAGMPALFAATLRLARLTVSSLHFVLGFAIFATFGLLMDIYSFANVWVQSGVASGVVALTLHTSLSSRSPLRKLIYASALGWLAMGFYQTYPYVMACSLVAAFLARFASGSSVSRADIKNEYLAPAMGVLVAVALYFVTNKLLHALHVPGYEKVWRPFGAKYIHTNLASYSQVIRDGLNAFGGPYAVYLSKIGLTVTAAALASALWASRRSAGVLWILFAVIVVMLMLPNPTNLLMKTFWPSPRSLSPVAIVFPLLLIAASSRWAIRLAGVPVAHLALALVAASQCLVFIDAQKGRSDQQMVDFSMASIIVNRAYQEFPASQRPRVKVHYGPYDNGIKRPQSFEYGISLFAAPWSLHGLITYVSGGRVDGDAAPAQDCEGNTVHLQILKRDDVLLVCAQN